MNKVPTPTPGRVHPVPVATRPQMATGWLGCIYPELVASDGDVVSRSAEATLRAEYGAAGLDFDRDRPAA